MIDRLAQEHGTVPFAPHLTVCGVPGDLDVLDAAAAYVRECGLLPINVAKMAVTGAVTRDETSTGRRGSTKPVA